nr:hypothetical protein [Paludibacterium denitrificans]
MPHNQPLAGREDQNRLVCRVALAACQSSVGRPCAASRALTREKCLR